MFDVWPFIGKLNFVFILYRYMRIIFITISSSFRLLLGRHRNRHNILYFVLRAYRTVYCRMTRKPFRLILYYIILSYTCLRNGIALYISIVVIVFPCALKEYWTGHIILFFMRITRRATDYRHAVRLPKLLLLLLLFSIL